MGGRRGLRGDTLLISILPNPPAFQLALSKKHFLKLPRLAHNRGEKKAQPNQSSSSWYCCRIKFIQTSELQQIKSGNNRADLSSSLPGKWRHGLSTPTFSWRSLNLVSQFLLSVQLPKEASLCNCLYRYFYPFVFLAK